MHINIYTYIKVYTYTWRCVYVYIRICISIYVCIYIYICIYINIYTYIHVHIYISYTYNIYIFIYVYIHIRFRPRTHGQTTDGWSHDRTNKASYPPVHTTVPLFFPAKYTDTAPSIHRAICPPRPHDSCCYWYYSSTHERFCPRMLTQNKTPALAPATLLPPRQASLSPLLVSVWQRREQECWWREG